jgi:hypothetical protein
MYVVTLSVVAPQVPETQAKIFSATIRWERIGATPQMLQNLCDPAFCQRNPCTEINGVEQCFENAPNCVDFNFDMNAGCSTYDHRTVLYTVDAVFHDSAFLNVNDLPPVGTKAYTTPRAEFCLSTSATADPDQVACETVKLSILAHSDSNVGGNSATTRKLIYTRYQRLVTYSKKDKIWSATASFKTTGELKRFPQCLSQLVVPPQQPFECVENQECAICLAPQLGAVIEDCKECLADYANENLEVNTTVHFADHCERADDALCPFGCVASQGRTLDEVDGCISPWDNALQDSHQLYPVTNHHSPHVIFLPIVTVPRLDRQDLAVSMVLHT